MTDTFFSGSPVPFRTRSRTVSPGLEPRQRSRVEHAHTAVRQGRTGRSSVGLYFTDKPPVHFPLLIQLEHDGALDIPAGHRDFRRYQDDFRMPLEADVLAVYPHAHYLGKLLEGFATLPTDRAKG